MSLREKIIAGLFVFACLVIVGGVIYITAKDAEHASQVVALQNELAVSAETIEIQKGLYTKLTLQTEDLEKLLGKNSAELETLQKELKKTKSDLLTANRLVLVWKSAYEAVVDGNQEDVPTGSIIRKKVSFDKNFGMYGVSGFTLTDPPEATIKLQQNIPLEIAVTVSQDKDGKWKTHATTNDPNTNINIALAGVNPYLLKPKWYEKIGVSTDLALTGGNRFGVLGSVGVSYQIGQFDLGPKFWLNISDNVNYGAGVGMVWYPFMKVN